MSDDATPAQQKPPPVDRMSLLWRRLKEHRIAQWTAGYVALAYAIQQGVVLTTESLDWPHDVERVTMIALVLGLPLAMTLAWYHGERASRGFSRAEFSILSAIFVVGAFLFYTFARPAEQTAVKPSVQEASVTAARRAAADPHGAVSVAVLPFVNLSSDKEQEFFSDGMTEELTSALAKVPSLQVVARGSAFQFKGETKDVRAVGQALGARYLVDGSVRKEGNRVRITAQLIEAENGVNVWTDKYDRELTSVFATQEDIATAIVGALRVPLGLRQGETLISSHTDDLELYQQYLHARALVRARSIPDAIAILEPITARDPNYSPAWALLARAYGLAPTYSSELRSGSLEEARLVVQSSLDRAENAARQAIRLDSRNAVGYAALARTQANHQNWAIAEDLFRQALMLDPSDPEVLDPFSQTLATIGRVKEALSLREKLRALEPFVPIFNSLTAEIMQANGQWEASISVLEQIPRDAAGGFYPNVYLARAHAVEGRYAKAADTLLLISGNQVSRRAVEDAARLLRMAPTKVSAPEALPVLDGELNFVYAHIGALDRVLEYPERLAEIHYLNPTGLRGLWRPDYAPLRKTARFKALVRKAGFVDYWKARSWPDMCHPTTGDDFACE
jgi:TolB-like protein/tetratricopeptide (TPR) repeat protein